MKRDVWTRDGGRCAFVGTRGQCTETGFLEFHHVEPYAAGGPATVQNIQLRCRAHNVYEAELFFGTAEPMTVRERPGAYITYRNSFWTESGSDFGPVPGVLHSHPADLPQSGHAPGWRNWQTLGT